MYISAQFFVPIERFHKDNMQLLGQSEEYGWRIKDLLFIVTCINNTIQIRKALTTNYTELICRSVVIYLNIHKILIYKQVLFELYNLDQQTTLNTENTLINR